MGQTFVLQFDHRYAGGLRWSGAMGSRETQAHAAI